MRKTVYIVIISLIVSLLYAFYAKDITSIFLIFVVIVAAPFIILFKSSAASNRKEKIFNDLLKMPGAKLNDQGLPEIEHKGITVFFDHNIVMMHGTFYEAVIPFIEITHYDALVKKILSSEYEVYRSEEKVYIRFYCKYGAEAHKFIKCFYPKMDHIVSVIDKHPIN